MKNWILCMLFIASCLQLEAQNKWTILAGGTPDAGTPAPYFSPSQLTVQVGDTVVWNNIEGWHDVTTTSGPEDFSSGTAGSGWTHEFVFTQVGTYNYECSVGSHALTQFGTITVVENQTKYTVVAGGTPDASTPAPYFSPSRLTIQQGDTVVWNNIEGWHDITMTSGPDNFSYGPAGSGWTHEFVFTQLGTYDYECAVGTHALTQFGTITVETATVSVDDIKSNNAQVSLFPNPATDNVQINWELDQDQLTTGAYIVLTDMFGKEAYRTALTAGQTSANIDLSQMIKGSYLVTLQNNSQVLWATRLMHL